MSTQAAQWQLPPKPLALDVAYRRYHGLSDVVRVTGRQKASEWRIAPYAEQDLRARDVRALRQYVDRFSDRIRRVTWGDVAHESWPKLPRSKLWGIAAMHVALNRLAEQWSIGALKMANYCDSVRELQLKRAGSIGQAAAILSPRMLMHQDVPHALRYAWAEHMQFAALYAVATLIHNGEFESASRRLQNYTKAMQGASLYPDPQAHNFYSRSHFGVSGEAHVDWACAALRAQNDGIDPARGPLSYLDLDSRLASINPWDLMALRLWPFADPATSRKSPLMQVMQRYYQYHPHVPQCVDTLQRWASTTGDIFTAESGNEAPRLTGDSTLSRQLLERVIGVGCVALRDSDGSAAQVAQIAGLVHAILARPEAYPRLEFFHSTWLAMGILADAQRWEGGTPEFTRSLAGFGELFRRHSSVVGELGMYSQLRQNSAVNNLSGLLLLRTIDPLELWPQPTWYRWSTVTKTLAYVQAAHDAGMFEQSYAKRLQYSVTIARPNHRAAAIVVHGDAEGA